MFYNIYSTFHFANPENYTTFAGVNHNEYEKDNVTIGTMCNVCRV